MDEPQIMIPQWLVNRVGALVVELEATRAELDAAQKRIAELEADGKEA